MTDFTKIAGIAGIGAVTAMAAIAISLGGGQMFGSAAMPTAGAAPVLQRSPTTSTTALSVAPQIHATESGKCPRSGPNC